MSIRSNIDMYMISLNAQDWKLRFSPGMPKHPMASSDGWQFSFPTSTYPLGDIDSVNYVTTSKFDKLVVGQILLMTFRVTKSPDAVFEYGYGPRNPCERPAAVCFYLQKGLFLNNNDNSRWWAGPLIIDYPETDKTTICSVSLNPANWSNLHGHYGDEDATTIAGFNSAVAKAGAIGVTFGGGCYYGHGLWLSQGSATFTMKEYNVK